LKAPREVRAPPSVAKETKFPPPSKETWPLSQKIFVSEKEPTILGEPLREKGFFTL